MESILHRVYFICVNLMIPIKGEAFGTVVKKDIGQFSLYSCLINGTLFFFISKV